MAEERERSGDALAELAERLRARRADIERAVLNRIQAIADPTEVADPAYLDGLTRARTAALDYALAGIVARGDRLPPLPVPLLAQARLAARHGISLDTVLRRYFAGYALLGDFLVEEADREPPLRRGELKPVLKVQGALFDRLITAVTEEYKRESQVREQTTDSRRFERVKRLLDGELLDTSMLAYRFDGWHVGLVTEGGGAAAALRELGERTGSIALVVRSDEQTAWGWLGGRQKIDTIDLQAQIAEAIAGIFVALGEPAQGVEGWRLTHRQAAAALPIAKRCPDGTARYIDVALVASAIRDDLLSESLRHLYLEPLSRERDGGEAAKETLRAYFECGHNVSSAAATLGVNRNTVSSRLQAIETRLGQPLVSCAAELEAALGLATLEEHQVVGATSPID